MRPDDVVGLSVSDLVLDRLRPVTEASASALV